MQQIRFATRTELESMDNLYKGVLAIEFLDALRARCSRINRLPSPIANQAGSPPFVDVQAPKGTTSARFVANIEKRISRQVLGRRAFHPAQRGAGCGYTAFSA